MTARLSMTEAQIARAIRAGRKQGLVPVVTPIGIALLESDQIALPSADIEPDGGNSCDKAFGP